MTASRRVVRGCLTLVCVLSAAGVVGAADATTLPRNLCSLHIASRLQALGIAKTCKPTKAPHTQGHTVAESAQWGSVSSPANNTLRLLVIRGLSEAGFKRSLGALATSFRKPLLFPGSVTVSTWSNGIAVEAMLGVYVKAGETNVRAVEEPYAAPTLALANAVAAQS